ncbi:MAG TPA: sigma-70 family RNA polymerase sigma factor [Planctomycetota bacterium]|nr:sigma-70 family RNA polymerase sigma factor [Planctomycetota bacterium]
MERTARSDEQLVAQCQSGDFSAFEELYQRYQRPILAYIYQITRNYEEAACIAQDVFLKVFEHVDRFDITRRFSTWFYTIARNAAIDYLQSRSRKVMVTFTDLDRDDDGGSGIAGSAAAPAENVENQLARKEANGLLTAALDDLPQMYREIIELVIFQEKSYEDASVILGGISLGTLRSRMFHALRRLRTLLEKPGGQTGDNLL